MTTEGWILISLNLAALLLAVRTNRRLGDVADEISDLRQDLTCEP